MLDRDYVQSGAIVGAMIIAIIMAILQCVAACLLFAKFRHGDDDMHEVGCQMLFFAASLGIGVVCAIINVSMMNNAKEQIAQNQQTVDGYGILNGCGDAYSNVPVKELNTQLDDSIRDIDSSALVSYCILGVYCIGLVVVGVQFFKNCGK